MIIIKFIIKFYDTDLAILWMSAVNIISQQEIKNENPRLY